MGTNFYWIAEYEAREDNGDCEDDDPSIHIGKRSACGWYCYDCRVPLAVGGDSMVHMGGAVYDTCPKCGKGKQQEGYNGAMIELGFAKTPEPPQKPSGVQGASSFSWAQEPDAVIARCNESLHSPVIRDEYSRFYTGSQFLWMLDAFCPIRFTSSIGRVFS